MSTAVLPLALTCLTEQTLIFVEKTAVAPSMMGCCQPASHLPQTNRTPPLHFPHPPQASRSACLASSSHRHWPQPRGGLLCRAGLCPQITSWWRRGGGEVRQRQMLAVGERLCAQAPRREGQHHLRVQQQSRRGSRKRGLGLSKQAGQSLPMAVCCCPCRRERPFGSCARWAVQSGVGAVTPIGVSMRRPVGANAAASLPPSSLQSLLPSLLPAAGGPAAAKPAPARGGGGGGCGAW